MERQGTIAASFSWHLSSSGRGPRGLPWQGPSGLRDSGPCRGLHSEVGPGSLLLPTASPGARQLRSWSRSVGKICAGDYEHSAGGLPSPMHSSREGILHGCSPSGTTPSSPTAQHSSEVGLGASAPAVREQTLSRQGSDHHSALTAWCSSGHDASHTPIEGTKASTLRGKRRQHQTALTPKILNPRGLHKHAPAEK